MTEPAEWYEHNRQIGLLAAELAWLCRVLGLERDMPTGDLELGEFVMDPVRARIHREFLAADMAVDPIGEAVYALARGGHTDALAELAIEMLSHRDDRGVWS